MFNASLAYRVYGGMRFFERQEIKHALAYLRLMASSEDDGAFLRVVNFPTRGIGARSVEQLQDAAKQLGVVKGRTVPVIFAVNDAYRQLKYIDSTIRLALTFALWRSRVRENTEKGVLLRLMVSWPYP